jgi:hypothetical protein
MSSSTGDPSSPQPSAIPGGVFDPDDEYWADVPLLSVLGSSVEVIRGELSPRLQQRLLTPRRSLALPDGDGTFGVIANADVPTQFDVAVIGEYAIDYRRCVTISLTDALLGGFRDATEIDYVNDVRRHLRRVQELIDLGYVLARRDTTSFDIWLVKP